MAALRAAAAAAADGRTRIVLIDGDAGIGKSRLVARACAQARREGMLTAAGVCVPLGEGSFAFAPFIELLRQMQDDLGAERFGELAGPGLEGMLVPGQPVRPDPGSLFDQVMSFLIRLGESRPTVVAVEDLHWADASTRDLVAFLARLLRTARLALVLTYRGDELHRRHPLRLLLDDLERNPRLERIRLAGLSRAELAELVADLQDGPALPAEQIDRLLTRTQGNPFYVEELVAAAPSDRPLPVRLADVILSRVERLAEPTATLLRQATVLAEDLDDALLAAITGRTAEEATAAMRDALAHQFLVIEGRRCRFRHALVREALYEDLLPGERERLHRAAALALDGSSWAGRQPEHTRWATLAYHWDAACDFPQAFPAAVRAGEAAERVGALGEAAAWFERALRLWDRVPDPEHAARMNRAQLLLRAAEAVMPSLSPRALVLAEAARDALDDDAEPEERAAIIGRIGRMNWVHHRGTAAATAYEQAVALLSGRPPSAAKARSLADLGQSLLLRSQLHQAGTVLRDALSEARAVGALPVEAHALCSLGAALAELGRVGEGLPMLRDALRLNREAGETEGIIRAYSNCTSALEFSADYEEADRLAAEGAELAGQLGHRRGWAFLMANRVSVLTRCGRWADAERACAELDERGWGDFSAVALGRIPLLLGQGRHDTAREVVDHLLESTAGAEDVQFRAQALMRAGQVAAIGGNWGQARRQLGVALAIAGRTDDQFYRALAYGLAMSAEVACIRAGQAGGPEAGRVVATARAAADRVLAEAQAFASGLAERDTPVLPETSAWLATVSAEHERAWDRHDPGQWAAVAQAWTRVGQPAQAAAAQCREVDALLRTRGDRTQAAAVARSALAVADRLGAAALAAELRLLAQQGRLDLRVPEATGPGTAELMASLKLTPREADVLVLLAVGRTNREIGRALFISEKTASVHVTNVVRKLGVANRYAAAALAGQLGLSATGGAGQPGLPMTGG
jgi:DNA-binding CsgD family transcriptional regulator/tetratricopeptide (TPR) repeat protein